nr:lipocalin-like domain-containing protein [Thiocapsa imhoffii]
MQALLEVDPDAFEAPITSDPLLFPRDHAPHLGVRSEIWNLVGQLVDEDGHAYPFQFSLLRFALRPGAAERTSSWATTAVMLSGLRLYEPDRSRIRVRTAERLERDALGLAGGESVPARVWVADWSLTLASSEATGTHLTLNAAGEDLGLALELSGSIAPIALGELGLFGREGGAGFQGYLLPRLSLQGRLTRDSETVPVQGQAWLEHGWGNLIGGTGPVGLDRIALQLTPDQELICLQLRRLDGTGTPIPSCALIREDGGVQRFQRREILLEPRGRWRSAGSGFQFPVAWRLAIPLLELELTLDPLVKDQESAGPLPLWSGAVRVAGRQQGVPIQGRGWVEVSAESVTEPD